MACKTVDWLPMCLLLLSASHVWILPLAIIQGNTAGNKVVGICDSLGATVSVSIKQKQC